MGLDTSYIVLRVLQRRLFDVHRFDHKARYNISYNLIMNLVRLHFNLYEKLETHFRILCDFIRMVEVELLRLTLTSGCRTNVQERQQIQTLPFCKSSV